MFSVSTTIISVATTLGRTDSLYPLCLYKSHTMRIPKRPISFCLSILSPSRFSSSFVVRFNSGAIGGCSESSAAENLHHHHHPRRRRGGRHLRASHTMSEAQAQANGRKAPFQQPVGSDGGQNQIWSSPGWGCKIDIGKQIFCNRSLNMKNIVAVGFDMDYTLAQYMPETFESLAYDGTIRKLVYDLGYPTELIEWSFDWKYMVRGLVLDKKRGNILKMDRHKYVKIAYHGFTEISKEEKMSTYGNTLVRDSFDEPDYALIDTLFSLAEAYLFAQLVDFKDHNPGKIPYSADYSRMYKDVRAAVDLCHRDGTLKQMVAKDPEKYISDDPSIVPMLKMLRDSGRATFLVTNSLWDYTNVVMNYLCEKRTMAGSLPCNYDWLQNFDVVITGSCKPSFFHDEKHLNIYEVEPESGMLRNTDNGTPTTQVGSTSMILAADDLKKSCRVFQGGSVGHLHKLLSIEASSQVLYVGDHIYGDILRSKKVLGWRTMLVVPELEREVELLWSSREIRKELQLLRKERDLVEDQIHHMKWSLQSEGVDTEEKQKLSSELNELESLREKVRHRHQEAQRGCHQMLLSLLSQVHLLIWLLRSLRLGLLILVPMSTIPEIHHYMRHIRLVLINMFMLTTAPLVLFWNMVTGKTIRAGHEQRGLYYMDLPPSPHALHSVTSSQSEAYKRIMRWHFRLVSQGMGTTDENWVSEFSFCTSG